MIIQFVSLVLCAAVFFQTEPLLNLMSKYCRLPLRIIFFLLAICSAALAVYILQGFHPTPAVIAAQFLAAGGLFVHRVFVIDWRWCREHITRGN